MRGTCESLFLLEGLERGLKSCRHEEHCLRGNEDSEVYWGKEVTALVKRRTEEERRLRHYRL